MWAFSLKEKLIFGGIIVAFIGLIIFLCIATNVDAEGTVQEKYFNKGQTSVGVGISPTNGQPVTTVNNTSDEYIIFINDEDISIDKKDWLRIDKGDYVKIEDGEVIKIVEGSNK